MTNAKSMKKIITLANIVATAAPRDKPRRRKNSTPGFNPEARKSEIKIKTII